MDYSSLPSYPPPLPPGSDCPTQDRVWRLTPRQTRVLIDLVWLVGIVALLLWLRQTADAIRRTPPSPPPEPLEFKLVVKQFTRVHVGMTSAEVFSLLGPQRYVTFREPEIDDYERLIEAHPDRYPGQRYWAKWADPSDPSRWVAVLLVGGHVYHKLRHGV